MLIWDYKQKINTFQDLDLIHKWLSGYYWIGGHVLNNRFDFSNNFFVNIKSKNKFGIVGFAVNGVGKYINFHYTKIGVITNQHKERNKQRKF